MTDPDDTLPDNDPPDCSECGESEGHDPDCSEYVEIGGEDDELSDDEADAVAAELERSEWYV